MTIKYKIDGELLDQNRYFSIERTNRFAAAQVKKDQTWLCQLAAQHLKSIGDQPFKVIIDWFTPNQRKDPDNLAFAIKFILDGLQSAGVIANDGFKNVRGINHRTFEVDKQNPRIEITIETVE